MALTRLWTGIRTRGDEANGTDSEIVLIINEDGRDDLIHHTFPDTQQEDLETGKANFYEVPLVDVTIIPSTLAPSSIRVGIRGDDIWAPQDFFVFGEENNNPTPLALAKDIAKALSTDQREGQLSIPIPKIGLGNSTSSINELLVLMLTSSDGTDSPIQLSLKNANNIFVLFTMPPFPPEGEKQDHQDANQANFYYVPVTTVVKKDDLNAPDSIQLILGGSDAWLPASFFLFGLVNRDGVPVSIIPLVHLPDWNLGPLTPGAPMSLPKTP
jgi:hypothetical protein